MLLAIVKGRATATVRHASMRGQKLLLCVEIDASGGECGDVLLAVDQLGAGPGDVVMLSSDGQGISEQLGDPTSPVRWFTLGLVERGRELLKEVG